MARRRVAGLDLARADLALGEVEALTLSAEAAFLVLALAEVGFFLANFVEALATATPESIAHSDALAINLLWTALRALPNVSTNFSGTEKFSRSFIPNPTRLNFYFEYKESRQTRCFSRIISTMK